jgi:AraC family transcriptional regulator of adaptative response/methylated-DNA-[protein]-cysteine methyltransferase
MTLAIQADDQRYVAVQNRDPAADGVFFYGVRTTGVYCRPSCAARPARRENLSFYPTCDAAEQAGYRACKRCRPRDSIRQSPHSDAVRRACALIEAAEETPVLAELADAAGLSPFHFHRVFKAVTGVTPRAYGTAKRAERVQAELAGGASVTEAIYAAGYNASSRFYERATARLGMAPSAFRQGGAGSSIRFAVGQCSLGDILVAATEKGICAIWFGDDPDQLVRALQDRFSHAELIGGDAEFEKIVAKVVASVERPELGWDLPLDIAGTAFQQRVWQALRAIPPGETRSYTGVAAAIGQPSAVRAVASACASNVIAVAIPCHRVIRTDGSLSGYRWGVEVKRRLLEAERSISVSPSP